MKLEVLVTTMHCNDLSIYKRMNLQTDAIIANQCDNDEVLCEVIDNHNVKMVSTNTRGVSLNRNIAINHSTADYILFSDDDLIFNNGYEKEINDEFLSHPEAEAIKFNLHDLSSKRTISMAKIKQFEKATRKNISSSGVWGLVIKRELLTKHEIFFNETFGPGTDNNHGEDTIFIQELIAKRIKIFKSPVDIAGINQESSSWFKGFDKNYFFVSGKILAVIFPFLCYLVSIRSAFKFSRRENCKLPFKEILKKYYEGIKAYKKETKGNK